MDLILILRIIIFLVFCLVGFLIGSWVSPSKEIKNVKMFPSIKIEECEGGICPIPEEYLKNKKERR